ncbi:uncharacterized protein LOC130494770 [Raphanus sativus]|uniref:Uncharacterized protein LOC130494770 n=1 Tax=Raphanus sativus TaxID=3726 RepID=A0A9W3CX13_RAPSA|nr:uncharacterized protein LOC130494770 [Raphanus sativus]
MVFINTQLGTSSVDETIRSSASPILIYIELSAVFAAVPAVAPVSVVTAVSANAAVSAAAAVPYTTFDSLRLGRTGLWSIDSSDSGLESNLQLILLLAAAMNQGQVSESGEPKLESSHPQAMDAEISPEADTNPEADVLATPTIAGS